MRAHLRQVDWRSIVIDLITATAATGVSFWISSTDSTAQILSAGLLGYAFLLATYAVWEIARPELKARTAEIDRLQDEISELAFDNASLLDDNNRLRAENTKLDNENGFLSSEVDRLESRLSEYTAA